MGVEPQIDDKVFKSFASIIIGGILSVSAMSEETAFISFFLQKTQYYCKNIHKLLFYQNACISYTKFIYMKSFWKISCFSTEGKTVFSSFSKRYFIFLPFKRDTTVINSFSLYRCKSLLRNYRSISIWWISYNFQIYLTLYLMLVSVKRF